MRFDVQKSFTWNGRNLVAGDTVEIPDESSKIGPLTRSRFIRYAGITKATELPTVKEVAQEMVSAVAVEEQTASTVATAIRDLKTIVREAKERAKAAAKK